MTKDEAMKLAWKDEKKRNPHTAYNSWCRGYEAALRQAISEELMAEYVRRIKEKNHD